MHKSMARKKSIHAWRRLGVQIDIAENENACALDAASNKFHDTTGLSDANGRSIRKPRIAKGRRVRIGVSVNAGLFEIAELLAHEKGTSANKILSGLVGQCLFEAMRDLQSERRALVREWSKPCTTCHATGLVLVAGEVESCPRCEEIFDQAGYKPRVLDDDIPF